MAIRKRLAFPCPTCHAEVMELCVSRQGYGMSRYVHPERGVSEGSLDNIIKLRDWLMDYGDLFQESNDY